MEGGRNPIRIICDSKLRIPLDSQVVKTASQIETVVAFHPKEAEHYRANAGAETLEEVKRKLEQQGIILLEIPFKQPEDMEQPVNIAQSSENFQRLDLSRLLHPLYSPIIEKVETVRRGKVRRAKLYYLRDRVGKAAKVKEKL